MGIILSKFYDKPSTRDTLEKIEQEIQSIEERRWDKKKREQFIVQILSFIPITVLIANVCLFIYPSESSWRDKLLLSVPILILNLILFVCKKIVQWYSKWSLDNEDVRLRKLQKEKKKILELVCETESYRVATELLEKYDPKQLRRKERSVDPPGSPLNSTLTKIQASPMRTPQHPKQQQQPNLSHSPFPFHNQSLGVPSAQPQLIVPPPPPPTPIAKPIIQRSQTIASSNNHNTSIASIAASSVQGRPVRPVLSKDRSFFEKVVDWVVADGPENRFALICRYCYGHNGMSLAEEFETINFRCCYCYNLNTSTNKRQIHDQLQPERERASSLAESSEVEIGAKSTTGQKEEEKKSDHKSKSLKEQNGKSKAHKTTAATESKNIEKQPTKETNTSDQPVDSKEEQKKTTCDTKESTSKLEEPKALEK